MAAMRQEGIQDTESNKEAHMSSIVLMWLIHLKFGRSLPLMVTVKLVQSDDIVVASRNLHAVHVFLAGLVGL
jgi:hypothetical protein